MIVAADGRSSTRAQRNTGPRADRSQPIVGHARAIPPGRRTVRAVEPCFVDRLIGPAVERWPRAELALGILAFPPLVAELTARALWDEIGIRLAGRSLGPPATQAVIRRAGLADQKDPSAVVDEDAGGQPDWSEAESESFDELPLVAGGNG